MARSGCIFICKDSWNSILFCFIRTCKQLLRICRWSNCKSNRHCTTMGYTSLIGTERSKDKTDTASASW